MLVCDVRAGFGFERWRRCLIYAQGSREHEARVDLVFHLLHFAAAFLPCVLLSANVALLPSEGSIFHQPDSSRFPGRLHQEWLRDLRQTARERR